jgi:hypothetical protein
LLIASRDLFTVDYAGAYNGSQLSPARNLDTASHTADDKPLSYTVFDAHPETNCCKYSSLNLVDV